MRFLAGGAVHGERVRWPSRLAAAGRRTAGTLDLPLRRCRCGKRDGLEALAAGLLLFNALGALAVYLLQRCQAWLPLNPQKFAALSPDSAFNTAVSFITNTNWQGYSGESAMSYLTQMAGLAVQNFLSAAMHQQGIDPSTAAGNAFFQMLGLFAEFEHAIIVERVNACMARAKATGTKSGKAIGAPPLDPKKLDAARAALADGQSIRAAALAAGISVGAVAALKKEMA